MVRKGSALTITHRARIADSLRGRHHSVEALDRMRGRSNFEGRKHSLETRVRMGEVRAKSIASGVYWRGPTGLELVLYALLEDAGFEVETQKRFGRCVVDAWLPQERIVFEADGWFWHQDGEREVRRDAYLMDRGVLAIVHLTEEDLY